MAKKTVSIFALDLGYLRSGFAVVRQPGDLVLKHGTIVAEPERVSKVTEEVRIRRARTAFDGLRLALYYAEQDFGPLDAVVYEEPQWIGAALRRGEMSKASLLALGMALERMYLTLSLTGWSKASEMRPVWRIDPARWQPLFTGVTRLPKDQMKRLVRRTLALRMAEDPDFDVRKLTADEVDACAIGLTAGKLLLIEGTI